MYDIANAADLQRINYEAERGTVTRTEYVETIWQSEWATARKTRAFYIRVFLPWARLRHVPSNPVRWNLVLGSSEEALRSAWWQRGHFVFQYDRWLFARLAQSGEFTKAYDLSQSCLRAAVNPEDRAMAYSMCGASMLGTGNCHAAIDFFDQAIKASKSEPLAYVGRGEARSTMGDFNGAIADYSEAIRLNPSEVGWYVFRAELIRPRATTRARIRTWQKRSG